MIYDVALGVGSAVAGINACSVDAGIVSCAFAVRYALRHDLRYDRKYCKTMRKIVTYIFSRL